MKPKTATLIGIYVNSFLFLIKFVASLLSGSIAVLSDSLNSFSDIITSIAIYIAVNVGKERPDKKHPFGHHRAEPIAGLIVAIVAGVLSVEIVKKSIEFFISPSKIEVSFIVVSLVILSIIIKIFLSYFYMKYGKKNNSPAIYAAGVDSRNDVLASSLVLFSLMVTYFGFEILDPIVSILISGIISLTAYRLFRENIDYLMGKSPDEKFIDKLRKKAVSVKGVLGTNDIRAHYVGNYIHVEIHIEVDKDISTLKSHMIGKDVQKKIESIAIVDRAFIHIDPI